jgi:hypothetical protein
MSLQISTKLLVVATRLKAIQIRNSTSIAFDWIKGEARLKETRGQNTWQKESQVTILSTPAT